MKIRIAKELGFIYIVGDRKFVSKKDAEDYAKMKEVAEEYAKQESKIQKARQKEEELRNQEI